MKNIILFRLRSLYEKIVLTGTAISLFCKKYWSNFLMGVLYGLVNQFYWLYVVPYATPDQHKLFWITAIFMCALFCKVADLYAQSQSHKFMYQINFMMFSIIEVILVLNYFFAQYIEFQWI